MCIPATAATRRFNLSRKHAAETGSLREQAAASLRVKLWGVDADELHRDALAAGDLVLIYLAEPGRAFIGRAELGSAVREWTPSEAQMCRGDSSSGVMLAQVEECDPPVPMNAVLPRIDPAGVKPLRSGQCQGWLPNGRCSDHCSAMKGLRAPWALA